MIDLLPCPCQACAPSCRSCVFEPDRACRRCQHDHHRIADVAEVAEPSEDSPIGVAYG